MPLGGAGRVAVCVVTCIVEGSGRPGLPEPGPLFGMDAFPGDTSLRLVLYTDASPMGPLASKARGRGWIIPPLPVCSPDPAVAKAQTRALFYISLGGDPDLCADRYLYVDPQHVPAFASASRFLDGFLGNADVARYAHPLRGTVVAEAHVVARERHESVERVAGLLNHIRAKGFPDNVGLSTGGVLGMASGCPALAKALYAWAHLIGQCRAAQLSLDYALWVQRTGLRTRLTPWAGKAGAFASRPIAVACGAGDR